VGQFAEISRVDPAVILMIAQANSALHAAAAKDMEPHPQMREEMFDLSGVNGPTDLESDSLSYRGLEGFTRGVVLGAITSG
jgi:hypothetical protein